MRAESCVFLYGTGAALMPPLQLITTRHAKAFELPSEHACRYCCRLTHLCLHRKGWKARVHLRAWSLSLLEKYYQHDGKD